MITLEESDYKVMSLFETIADDLHIEIKICQTIGGSIPGGGPTTRGL